MNIFARWIRRIMHKPGNGTIRLDPKVAQQVAQMAVDSGGSEEQVLSELLSIGAGNMLSMEPYQAIWTYRLSDREREVAALICLGRTDAEITLALGITRDTIKVHARNMLAKFGLHRRSELRTALHSWDWSTWRTKYPPKR
jgi:DNA-binding CsgD family transcriptional regulator